jgi:hypothetical protein
MRKLLSAVFFFAVFIFFVNAGTYESRKFYYSIQLPGGWVPNDESDPSQVIFTNEGQDAAAVVGVFALESGTTNEDLLQAVIDRMRLKGNKQQIKFKGYNAITGNFTFVMNGARLIADIVIFNTDTCYFMIMGSSLRETYHQNLDSLKVIFSSFSLDASALDSAYKGHASKQKNTTKKNTDSTVVTNEKGNLYSLPVNWGDDSSAFSFLESDYYKAVQEGKDLVASGDLWAYYKVDPSTDPNFTQTFWARFFQDMYNKNYVRVSSMVEWFKQEARNKNWSAYQLAVEVVKCVQVIPYERPYQVINDESQAAKVLDYFTPNEIAWYNKGDCDTKSMLIVMILRQLGYDAVLYFSEYYQHAMAGLNINATGTYKMNGSKKYYFIESTYPGWNIGDLPPDFGDPDKWTLVVIQ